MPISIKLYILNKMSTDTISIIVCLHTNMKIKSVFEMRSKNVVQNKFVVIVFKFVPAYIKIYMMIHMKKVGYLISMHASKSYIH